MDKWLIDRSGVRPTGQRRGQARAGFPVISPRCGVALASTIFNFDIDLSHIDRGVYDTLALRVAQHPSESADYLITRVLAYCLEYTEGMAFSQGGI